MISKSHSLSCIDELSKSKIEASGRNHSLMMAMFLLYKLFPPGLFLQAHRGKGRWEEKVEAWVEGETEVKLGGEEESEVEKKQEA